MTERHKILFHLLPEANAADAFVSSRLKEIPQGHRNRAARAMLVAGAALAELDDRLPELLAAVLRTNVTPDELVGCLRAILPVEGSRVITVPAVEEPSPPPHQGDAFLSMINNKG